MSSITIYKTELTPARNALVDELDNYLSGRESIADQEIQYEKIDLDMSVKLALSQHYLDTQAVGNYAKIRNGDSVFYFFVTNYKWLSKNTIQLQLSIDSINTFRYCAEFSDKTTVIREHRNRFNYAGKLPTSSGTRMTMIVDPVDEGISPAVMLKAKDSAVNSSEPKWYGVIKTNDAGGVSYSFLTTAANASKLTVNNWDDAHDLRSSGNVYWYVIPNDKTRVWYQVDGQNPVNDSAIYKNYPSIPLWRITQSASGAKGAWQLQGFNSSGNQVYLFTVTKLHVISENVYYSGSAAYTKLTEVASAADARVKIQGVNTLDRTDSRLTKIIALPYKPYVSTYANAENEQASFSISPTTAKAQSADNYGDIELWVGTTRFNSVPCIKNSGFYSWALPMSVEVSGQTDWAHAAKDIKYESKLYHSSTYGFKLTYDSFSTSIPLENVVSNNSSAQSYPRISLSWQQSANFTSDLMFWYDASYAVLKDTGDYSRYLISTRNNELPIYNTDYLTYVKNGYNYDRKAATAQEMVSGVTAGISVVGAIASWAASGVTGGISAVAAISLTGTAITSIANAISTAKNAENTLAQKLNEAKNQSANIISANAEDLFETYGGNRLHIMQYEPTEQMRQRLFDLYYYCGYATNEQKVPDTTSRYWFNYIQADVVFDDVSNTDVFHDYLEDIKARYSAGVTVYHVHDGEYDWAQQYENWEAYLV